MKTVRFKWAITALIVLMSATVWAADEAPVSPVKAYLIGAGDILDISVWKNLDLTRQVVVLPDGKITFPLIGELQAAGKTVASLHKELEIKLNRYVPDVSLSMMVAQVNSMLIYVIGRANNPGRFVLNTNANVLQALAMAGGLNPFAKRGKIKIFREEGAETKTFSFDFDEVAKGEALEQNIRLHRGDVIVVP